MRCKVRNICLAWSISKKSINCFCLGLTLKRSGQNIRKKRSRISIKDLKFRSQKLKIANKMNPELLRQRIVNTNS